MAARLMLSDIGIEAHVLARKYHFYPVLHFQQVIGYHVGTM
jgi:hypothetical protein